MQLIQQFRQIFNIQQLNLPVRPYQVLSISHDSGIIQMLQDVTTIDGLKKKICKNNWSLKTFFEKYFGKYYIQAKKNFRNSLVAYSLITYFLQVKDRHNGNILLNRYGFLIHIDFGFFLSNNPGGKIQLQKQVPFKLLTQYIDVIGGNNSTQFDKFRLLFYKGYKAILKHKDRIIILIKMMYSTHGSSMPCFKTGDQCIYKLQQRFPNVTLSKVKNNYSLINGSIDNWRARWYDKFQYFFQGIFY